MGISQFIPSFMDRLNRQSHRPIAYASGVGIMDVYLSAVSNKINEVMKL